MIDPISAKAYIIKKLLDEACKDLLEFLRRTNKTLKVSTDDVENGLSQHLAGVNSWSDEITFRDINEPKKILTTYVPLDYTFNSVRSIYDKSSIRKTGLSIEELINKNDSNLIILGQPGAGKTTTMKFICKKLLTDESFLGDAFNFPMVIRLRLLSNDYTNKKSVLFPYIFNEFGLIIKNKESVETDEIEDFKIKAVIDILNKLQPLIIIDGFDEIPNKVLRDMVLRDIEKLSLNLINSKFILTSRSADFDYSIEKTRVYEIAPLESNQVLTFAKNWLHDDKLATEFIRQIYLYNYQHTAIRPLTLSHLCTIFERENKIPNKPRVINQKIIHLLIEDWSIQNRVSRLTKFSNFEEERKHYFLSNIAYELTTTFKKSHFNTSDLKQCYLRVNDKFGLPQDKAKEVVKELESHNGLFFQTSSETYEFAHKTYQEFLCGEYIVKLPTVPSAKDLLEIIPNEIAIAVSLSSDPSEYFNVVLAEICNRITDLEYIGIMFNRINLEKPEFSISLDLAIRITQLFDIEMNHVLNYSTSINEKVDQLCEMFLALIQSNACLTESMRQLVSYYTVVRKKPHPGLKRKTFHLTRKGIKEIGIKYDFLPDEKFLVIGELFT